MVSQVWVRGWQELMGAHFFKDGTHSLGVIHLADIYTYQGLTFEHHKYCGPLWLRKDLEVRTRQPGPGHRFWSVYEQWSKLSDDEKERTRIYG